ASWGAPVGESVPWGFPGGRRFPLRYEQGRLREAEETMATLAAAQPGMPLWRAWLALLYCETQRPEKARSHFEALTTEDLAGIPRDLFWLFVVVALGSVAGALRDGHRSPVIYGALAPYAGRIVSHGPFTWGPVDLTLGLLATHLDRFDAADRHFAASDDLCQR